MGRPQQWTLALRGLQCGPWKVRKRRVSVSAAQRDLLALVDAMRAASMFTEAAELTAEEDEYLSQLGTVLAHQLAAARMTADAMRAYVELSAKGGAT